MTTDRLSALQAVKADALALAAKAKALGLDAATVDQLAATVSAGLTEAAVKTRAPDSWRVTVRRWALVPVDQVFEVVADDAEVARHRAQTDAENDATAAVAFVAGAEAWWRVESLDGQLMEPMTRAIAAEPVWEPVAAPVEPEPIDPEPEPGPLPVEPVEPVKVDEPVRIGPEPIPPAPKDDGIYEAVAMTDREIADLHRPAVIPMATPRWG